MGETCRRVLGEACSAIGDGILLDADDKICLGVDGRSLSGSSGESGSIDADVHPMGVSGLTRAGVIGGTSVDVSDETC